MRKKFLAPGFSICYHESTLQLRTYQAKAVEFAQWHIARGVRSVIQLPTGTGKSLVLLSIAADAGKQGQCVYLIAPTYEAVSQIQRLALFMGLRVVVDMGQRVAPRLAPCILTTYATAWRRFRRRAPANTLLLLDECHHVNYLASVNVQILRSFPLAIGASATPWSRGCLDYFDRHRHVYGLAQSIAEGHNAPYRIRRWQVPQAVDSPIIYANNHDDLMSFCQLMKDSDYAVYKRSNARQVIKRYRLDILSAIVVRRMLTEGFDNPQCKAVYIARQTRSRIAAMQMAGRALRPHGGKAASIFVVDEDVGRLVRRAMREAG